MNYEAENIAWFTAGTNSFCSSGRRTRDSRRLRDLAPDQNISRLLEQERAHHKRNARHNHRIPKSCVDVAGGRAGGESNQRKQASKDTVPDVVWQGKR